MTRLQQAYFEAFLIALVICWSPANFIAYLSPLIGLAWLLWRTGLHVAVVRRLALVGGLLTAGICLFGLFDERFVFQNALLSVLAYGSFYPLLAVPSRLLSSRTLLVRASRVLAGVVLLEGLVGIVQAGYGYTVTRSFDIRNGDFVEGTIHPWLPSEESFSNPMFAVNMALAIVVLLAGARRAPGRWWFAALWVGVLALVLASVLHVLLFLLIAAAAASLLVMPWRLAGRSRGLLGTGVALGGTALVAMLLLLPGNLATLRSYAEVTASGDNPKVEVTRRLLVDGLQSSPARFFLGYGPGQGISRSGLIATGGYFGGILHPRPLPLLEPVITDALDRYVMDLWIDVATRPYPVGSTRVPYSSWLAGFSEVGLLGFLALVGWLAVFVLRTALRGVRRSDPEAAWALCTGALLLFLLGAQEHYWEVPQAVLVGCLGLKLLHARLMVDTQAGVEAGGLE